MSQSILLLWLSFFSNWRSQLSDFKLLPKIKFMLKGQTLLQKPENNFKRVVSCNMNIKFYNETNVEELITSTMSLWHWVFAKFHSNYCFVEQRNFVPPLQWHLENIRINLPQLQHFSPHTNSAASSRMSIYIHKIDEIFKTFSCDNLTL